jgi:hypothetical protein
MSCLFAPSPTQTRSLSEGCSVWALGFGQLGATTTRTCLELFNKLLLVPGFFVCPSIHFEAAALQPRHTGARAPPTRSLSSASRRDSWSPPMPRRANPKCIRPENCPLPTTRPRTTRARAASLSHCRPLRSAVLILSRRRRSYMCALIGASSNI